MNHSGIGVRYATDLWRTASAPFLRRRISFRLNDGWRKILRKIVKIRSPRIVGVKYGAQRDKLKFSPGKI